MRRFFQVFLLVFMTGVLTGCFGLISDVGNVTIDVVFADTFLRLRSVIAINETVRQTVNGRIQMDLDIGTRYAWEVQTLLGRNSGAFVYNGTPTVSLTVDAFNGWKPKQFNTLLVTYPDSDGSFQPVTVRWPYGKTVAVWIESPRDNPHIVQRYYDYAQQALREWERHLNNAIAFRIVHEVSRANLTIRFVDALAGGFVGQCQRAFDARTGMITEGTIVIARDGWDIPSVYLHEAGHCIGLNHSLDPGDVMYERLGTGNTRISSREANYTRLLYSIESSAPLPAGSIFDIEESFGDMHRTVRTENGIIVETLYDM